MNFLSHVYRHINILSFDVVAGAVVGAMFLGRLFSVSVPLAVRVALALSVWIVYTLDHLRDAMAIPTRASTDRHRFHQKYFGIILTILIIVIAVDVTLIWFLPAAVVKASLILGPAVLVYLFFQKHLRFFKEFFVACLYTAGILLPSLAEANWDFAPEQIVIIVKYFLTALMNLLLFSLFDFHQDRYQRQHSFVTRFGPVSARYWIIVIGLINIFGSFWLTSYDPDVALVFICMDMILFSVLYFDRRLVVNNYYRMIGDAVFFIPLLYTV